MQENRRGNFLETLLQDIRYSLRLLRKSPGFTVAAVLTLALAIGANAIVFSVMNTMIIRPLNVPDPQSLFMLERGPDKDGSNSYPDYIDLRDRNRTFDSLAAWTLDLASLDFGTGPIRTWPIEVTSNYFDALRIQPYLGRFFHPSDEHGPNSAPYIVLTYEYWQNHFHGDRAAVGRTVLLNQHPFTILGITKPEFHGTLLFLAAEFFVPIVNHEQIAGGNVLNERGNHWVFSVIGHLKPGVTPSQAVADLNSIGSYLEKTFPKEDGKMTFSLARPSLFGSFLGPPLRAFLTGLMLLAGLILLAACANLGSLFAARASDRTREVALRLALGAGRGRILRTLFTEATLISFMGGAVGVWAGIVLLRAMSVWHPVPRYPLQLAVNPDARVYGVALLLTILSGLLFGAVPVRSILRTDPYEVVKSGSRTTGGRRLTFRDVLLVAQIAICAVLVTASFVAVRGLARSLHSDFGFAVENTILVDTDLAMAGYRDERVPAMQKRMLDAVKSIPGVESVGLADGVPLSDGAGDSNVFSDSTTDLRPANAVTDAQMYSVSPEYFHAAGTTMLSGRAFTWHDDKNAPRVAVVNRQFARKMFGAVPNALGHYFKRRDGTRYEVVGIVEDGKYGSLTEDPTAAMFFPFLQSASSATYFVVRSGRDFEQLAPAIRNTLRQLDPGLAVSVQTRYKALDAVLFPSRMATMSLGVMGAIGAVLAITGIFGMAAFSVSKRLRELGIRIAIGARPTETLRAALGRPIKLLALGSAAGLLLGILASRILSFIVYEATPRDPLVLAGVVLAMALLGLIATWIPAQRALSLDPIKLLREE